MVGKETIYYDWRNPRLTVVGLKVTVEIFSFSFTIRKHYEWIRREERR